jgi:hypothetical protein
MRNHYKVWLESCNLLRAHSIGNALMLLYHFDKMSLEVSVVQLDCYQS